MTQCYTHLKLKSNIPTIKIDEIDNKRSFELFIKHCCSLSQFDADYEELDDVINAYKNFCLINHLEEQQPSENQLN